MSLRLAYEERKKEVEIYLNFLERLGQVGIENSIKAEPDQQKILYATIYLLLYNLVESTITRCGEELDQAFSKHKVSDIFCCSNEIRKVWIKHTLQYKNEATNVGIDVLSQKLSHDNHSTLSGMKFNFEGRGNWDSRAIENLLKRYGIDCQMPNELKTEVEQHRYEKMGIMQTVKHLRNDLAHGAKSFIDCGDGITITEINERASIVFKYLEFIITKIEKFISNNNCLSA